MLEVSRQAVYQTEKRFTVKRSEVNKIVDLVQKVRCLMPRLGARKLYDRLKEPFVAKGLKVGRGALFDILRSQRLLIRPKRSYTKTTFSNHWLKKHPKPHLSLNMQTPNEVHKKRFIVEVRERQL